MASESPRKLTCVTMETLFDNSSKDHAVEDNRSTDAKEPCKFTLEALSNFLILQNDFDNLSDNDLETCCQVNPCWKSVVDLILIRHYEIEVKHAEMSPHYNHESDVTKSNYLVIKKISSPYYSNVTELKYSFPEACKFLHEVLQTEKISIDLSINIQNYDQDENTRDFLSEFGHLVTTFSPKVSYTMSPFCSNLVRHFPNVQCINLTNAYIDWDYTASNINTNLPESQLKHLTKIYYRSWERTYKNLVAILSIAPNLKEFYNFPILYLKALVITQKADTVKSLTYPSSYKESEDDFDYNDEFDHESENDSDNEHENGDANPNRETFDSALEKFALLQPKLAEFDFHICEYCPDDYLCEEPRQSSVKRILQSSHDSLKSLSIFLWTPFDFSGLSPFTALTKIEFLDGDDNWDGPQLFNDSNADLLPKIFPKVRVIDFDGCNAADLPPLLPANVLSSWGTQIEELQMKWCDHMTADIILSLSQSFNSVKKFQFNIRAAPENLKLILPAIAEKWPAMESLTIKVKGCYVRDIKEKPCTFDSVFTGISDDILEQLKDPLTRAMITSEVIREFRDRSPLLKMSNLKTLEMDFMNCTESYKFIDRLSTITFASKEFGFDFIPDLKFVFRLNHDYLPDHVQAALSPLVQFEIRGWSDE